METTLESLEAKAQAIFRTEAGLEGIDPDFCYARIPEGVHSVGVQGDERTYGPVVILNVTRTSNGIGSDRDLFSKVYDHPDLIQRVSTRITNELKGISRVNITLPY